MANAAILATPVTRTGKDTSVRMSHDPMVKIVFEFVGGLKDGNILRGERGIPSDAERFYLLSNRGTVGQQLKIADMSV